VSSRAGGDAKARGGKHFHLAVEKYGGSGKEEPAEVPFWGFDMAEQENSQGGKIEKTLQKKHIPDDSPAPFSAHRSS